MNGRKKNGNASMEVLGSFSNFPKSGKNMVNYCSECGREGFEGVTLSVDNRTVCMFCMKKWIDMRYEQSNEKIVDIVLSVMKKHKELLEGMEVDKALAFANQIADDIMSSFSVEPTTYRVPPQRHCAK